MYKAVAPKISYLGFFGAATLYIDPLPFFARLRSKFGAITP